MGKATVAEVGGKEHDMSIVDEAKWQSWVDANDFDGPGRLWSEYANVDIGSHHLTPVILMN